MDEKAKILIVEDERIIALETKYKLESMGYDVPAIASSGEEAIGKAQELSPDLILMDIILQGDMDGVEAAGQIRTRFNIPVVYVTANVSDSRLEDITHSEPFGCLFKPFEDMELQAAVKMALYRHKMEKTLRESEEKLHKEMNFSNTLIQASPAFFVAINADGKTIMMNESMLNALGCTADEVTDKDYILTFVPEIDQELLSGVFEKIIKLHEPFLTENRVLTRDGRELLVEWHGRSVFDENGTFEYFFGTGVDITERRQVEEKLKESDRLLRLITENMHDLVFLIDLNGNIQYTGPALQSILGYTIEERIGRSSFDIIHPEDLEKVQTIFVNAISNATPVKLEYRLKHADGHYIWVETIGNFALDADGKIAGVILDVRDITDRKQAEEKMRESEERYRLIAENMYDMIRLVDTQGTNIYSSPSHKAVLGYSPEERVGKSSFEVVHPDDMGNVQQIFAEALVESKPARVEYRARHADGHYVWIETISNFIYDDSGQIAGGVLSSRDITDRRQTEEKLRKSEERYRTIIEGMEDGFFEVDLTGRFTALNEAICRIVQLPADELIGMSTFDYTSPQTEKKLYHTFSNVFRTGEPADVEDYEIIRRDGSKRILELSASMMRDEKGEPVGFRGIVRDVTKRKEMERELEGRFQYLEGILEAAPYAIIALDRFHHILRWNPGAEKLFGYSQEETIGRELDSLVAATTAETMDEANIGTKTVLSGKTLSPWETVRFRKNDSPVHVIASGSAIMVNGELIGVVAIYVDITDRKLAEQEIKSHQEHLTLINQILRHDITNDLLVIQSAINLYNKSREEEFLEAISSHAEKSIKLIQRMGGLEKFISTHRELKIIELVGVIEEIIKNYDFISFVIKGKARIMADDSVGSVLDNIVRNAVIHGKADRIAIDISEENDMCEVRIADNGVGIPDDIKKTIFEEGFTHGDTGHTGIGLHVVQKAMEGYGGYCWAEDNKPRGAVFALRFRRVK